MKKTEKSNIKRKKLITKNKSLILYKIYLKNHSIFHLAVYFEFGIFPPLIYVYSGIRTSAFGKIKHLSFFFFQLKNQLNMYLPFSNLFRG